jgi:prolyl oligopeptidase
MRATFLLFPAALIVLSMAPVASAEETDDPHLWLEDVEGEQALDWVRARNADSTGQLEAADGFEATQKRLRAMLDSPDKIHYVSKQGDYLYNVWKGADHPRGLWRRTTVDSYQTEEPVWESVLDVDALGAEEGISWVWGGADCLPPAYDRCLISLSPGGSDADVVREFDVPSLSFVEGGFELPEAKQSVNWIDQDTVFVATDFGEGSLTDSGYPRIVKRWKRGTPLESATTVLEGEAADISVGAVHDHTPGFAREIVYRGLTFWTRRIYVVGKKGLTELERPLDCGTNLWREHILFEPRSDWDVNGTTYKAGSLLVARFADWKKGKKALTVLFEPTDSTSLVGVTTTRNNLIVKSLEHVRSRIEVLTPGKRKKDDWARSSLPGLPELGRVSAWAVDEYGSDEYWLTVSDFLTPTTLSMGTIGGGPAKALAALPAQFDASGLVATQHFAASKDGTKIPYFQVAREGLALDGTAPTLLYGYGGFEISLQPRYSATRGITWLERGGVYVIANIRGGGEYGPRWHQAALKEKRHRAYEDFAAVADDLVARKVTSPKHIGAQGGSNGGLLVGNMYTLYPERFGAILCGVPLLDMRRYSKLLAGASWMGEYWDPDVPEEWAYIQTFSPYHNFDASQEHPPMLLTTSTRDDRVHPGHARKMTAKLLAAGKDVLYYENIEGGHGGAADNGQRAHLYTLQSMFLWNTLTGEEPAQEAADPEVESTK